MNPRQIRTSRSFGHNRSKAYDFYMREGQSRGQSAVAAGAHVVLHENGHVELRHMPGRASMLTFGSDSSHYQPRHPDGQFATYAASGYYHRRAEQRRRLMVEEISARRHLM